ncbi:hypothetical protein D3C85_1806150 [compost metagenome]
MMAPMKAPPKKKAAALAQVKVGSLKRPKSKRGASLRRSAQMNKPSPARVRAARPRICTEAQA